jgi:hypothetical protein
VAVIEFPIIQFTHRGSYLYIYKSEGEWTTCSSGALKSDYFAPPLEFVDSQCECCKVGAVKRVGFVGPMLGFSLKYGRRYRIAYELGESTQLTLEEVKEKVKAAVHKNGNRWTSTGYTLRGIQERVDAAKDFQGVVQALTI